MFNYLAMVIPIFIPSSGGGEVDPVKLGWTVIGMFIATALGAIIGVILEDDTTDGLFYGGTIGLMVFSLALVLIVAIMAVI